MPVICLMCPAVNSPNVLICCTRSSLLQREGDSYSALRDCEVSLELDSSNQKAAMRRILSLCELGWSKEAEAFFAHFEASKLNKTAEVESLRKKMDNILKRKGVFFVHTRTHTNMLAYMHTHTPACTHDTDTHTCMLKPLQFEATTKLRKVFRSNVCHSYTSDVLLLSPHSNTCAQALAMAVCMNEALQTVHCKRGSI